MIQLRAQAVVTDTSTNRNGAALNIWGKCESKQLQERTSLHLSVIEPSLKIVPNIDVALKTLSDKDWMFQNDTLNSGSFQFSFEVKHSDNSTAPASNISVMYTVFSSAFNFSAVLKSLGKESLEKRDSDEIAFVGMSSPALLYLESSLSSDVIQIQVNPNTANDGETVCVEARAAYQSPNGKNNEFIQRQYVSSNISCVTIEKQTTARTLPVAMIASSVGGSVAMFCILVILAGFMKRKRQQKDLDHTVGGIAPSASLLLRKKREKLEKMKAAARKQAITDKVKLARPTFSRVVGFARLRYGIKSRISNDKLAKIFAILSLEPPTSQLVQRLQDDIIRLLGSKVTDSESHFVSQGVELITSAMADVLLELIIDSYASLAFHHNRWLEKANFAAANRALSQLDSADMEPLYESTEEMDAAKKFFEEDDYEIPQKLVAIADMPNYAEVNDDLRIAEGGYLVPKDIVDDPHYEETPYTEEELGALYDDVGNEDCYDNRTTPRPSEDYGLIGKNVDELYSDANLNLTVHTRHSNISDLSSDYANENGNYGYLKTMRKKFVINLEDTYENGESGETYGLFDTLRTEGHELKDIELEQMRRSTDIYNNCNTSERSKKISQEDDTLDSLEIQNTEKYRMTNGV
eukprot:m.61105 g.61105  ORF g.61105 m.61105 type:complete len:636 (-) comp11378_c0_seq2:85-1992(-)